MLAASREAGYQPAGAGVSATGQIDSARGIVAGTCGSLPGWPGAPIRAALEAGLGLPVTVANDANCMILGEAWVGAARGCADVLGVTIGTGLGGGVLTGGRLLEGARGLGGELAICGPTRWTASPAPAARRAAGSGTLPPPPWCAGPSGPTPPWTAAAPSLPPPARATKPSWPCWRAGSPRSPKGWPGWSICSTPS